MRVGRPRGTPGASSALVLALALGGCTDQRGAAASRPDVRAIKAVVTRAWTSTDPAVRCAAVFTRELVARVYGTRPRCRRTLAAGNRGTLNLGGRATAAAIKADGDRATAIVRLRGGLYIGARGQISLVKQHGAWMVSDLSAGFLRSQLRTRLSFSAVGEETTSYVELTCIHDAFAALDDATFKAIAMAALAGGSTDPRLIEVFTTCTGNPAQFIPVGPRGGTASDSRLTITPRIARPRNEFRPGDVLQLGVLSMSDRTITFGLAVRIGRLVAGRWRDATKAVYGTAHPPFTRQAFSVAPGAHRPAGEVRLPASLPPGTYRILKRISSGPDAPRVHATLGETFIVRLTRAANATAPGTPPRPGVR